jgi:ABC-2 type transport system permease protein
MNLIVVLGFALATGVSPQLGWLEMPLLILLIGILAVGIGMVLAPLYVRFRDVQPIWEVVSQILFYASPIIYTAAQYPRAVLRIAMANPVAAILTEMHHAFIDASAHGVAREIGGWPRLIIPLGLIFGVAAFGVWFFTREAPRIAENL